MRLLLLNYFNKVNFLRCITHFKFLNFITSSFIGPMVYQECFRRLDACFNSGYILNNLLTWSELTNFKSFKNLNFRYYGNQKVIVLVHQLRFILKKMYGENNIVFRWSCAITVWLFCNLKISLMF